MQLAAARNGEHRARIVLFARLKSRVNLYYFQISKEITMLPERSQHLQHVQRS
jgi:hypothetical protein